MSIRIEVFSKTRVQTPLEVPRENHPEKIQESAAIVGASAGASDGEAATNFLMTF